MTGATAASVGALYLSAPAVAISTPLATTNPLVDQKTFHITWPGSPAIKACLSAFDSVTVQHNGGSGDPTTWTSMKLVTDYSLDRLGGVITCKSAVGAGVSVRVSAGKYLPLRTFLNCKEYDLTVDSKNVDTTVLNTTTVSRLRVQLDCKGTLTNFYNPDLVYGDLTSGGDATQIYVHLAKTGKGHNQYFTEMPTTDIITVAQFWSNSINPLPSMMAWAKVSEDAIKVITGDVVSETVQFEGTVDADGHMIYRLGANNPGDEYYMIGYSELDPISG